MRSLFWIVVHAVLAALLFLIFMGGALMVGHYTGVGFGTSLAIFVAGWVAAWQAADWLAIITIRRESRNETD